MELNKKHRDALLQELERAQEDLRKQNEGLEQYGNRTITTHDPEIAAFFEVGKHLAEKRIEDIKKCLIDNELFNF